MGRMRHTSSDIGQEGMVWWGRKRAQATRFEAPCRREHLAGSTRRCRRSKFLGDVYVYESLFMLGLRLLLAVAVSQSTQATWTMGRVRRVLQNTGKAVADGGDSLDRHISSRSIVSPSRPTLGNGNGSRERGVESDDADLLSPNPRLATQVVGRYSGYLVPWLC